MKTPTIAQTLTTGANADIFYDAHDYDDTAASELIENFQVAAETAANILAALTSLDTSGETLNADDFATLRRLQEQATS